MTRNFPRPFARVAVAATVGPPTSPMFGFIGAGLGALVGATQATK